MNRPLRGTAILLFLAFSAFYAALQRGVFVFGDDVLMYQVTEAVVERRDLAVGSPIDAEGVARSVRGRDGRGYSKYGIGGSLVAVPFFAVSRPLFDRFELPETRDGQGNLRTGARVFGTSLATPVAAGAAIALTFLLAIEFGLPALAALATALALGGGTPFAHYATTFLSEPLSACCLVGALLGLARAERRASPAFAALAASGFAAGGLVATKAAHLVAVVPIAIAVVRLARRRGGARSSALLAWAAPFASWLAVVALYDAARFGDPLETGYGGEAARFTTPLARGLVGLLVSPGKGILVYAPILVLSAFGARRLWQARPALAATCAASVASLLALVGKYYQWWGGDCWGPRLLVPVLPLLILPAGGVLAGWKGLSAARRLAISALALASVGSASLPLLVPFDGGADRISSDPARLERSIWTAGGSPIVAAAECWPRAARETLGRLAGRLPFAPDDGRPRYPDAAFVRYGSHALLQWTRAGLAAAALLLGAALLTVHRRNQKALLSSPPQY